MIQANPIDINTYTAVCYVHLLFWVITSENVLKKKLTTLLDSFYKETQDVGIFIFTSLPSLPFPTNV
jgi:hypothetical protein